MNFTYLYFIDRSDKDIIMLVKMFETAALMTGY